MVIVLLHWLFLSLFLFLCFVYFYINSVVVHEYVHFFAGKIAKVKTSKPKFQFKKLNFVGNTSLSGGNCRPSKKVFIYLAAPVAEYAYLISAIILIGKINYFNYFILVQAALIFILLNTFIGSFQKQGDIFLVVELIKKNINPMLCVSSLARVNIQNIVKEAGFSELIHIFLINFFVRKRYFNSLLNNPLALLFGKYLINDRVFVLKINYSIAGYVFLHENYFYNLYVLPVFRRKGMGSCLIRHIEGVASKKYNVIICDAPYYLDKFYRKLGYKKR